MPTIHERVAAARERLVAAGIPREEADRDARLLARVALNWDPTRFWTAAADPEPADFAATFDPLVARRATREPVAYITGQQEFWGLSFTVTPSVLIPRPETELIVEAILELLPDRSVSIDLADVCTGSGCLAVAFARELPNARIVATDISAAALDVARRNAVRHAVSSRIELVASDLLAEVDRAFHVIVSNPPYVPDAEKQGLQPEVRDYEPAIALFAGDGGLATIRRLLEQSTRRLKQGGLLVFELGVAQADRVGELIGRTTGLKALEIRPDLRGIPRTALVQRV